MVIESRFRVVIFSGADADHILRLIQRIHHEVPEAHVCGVVSERRPGKSMSRRAFDFLGNLRSRDFVAYAGAKVSERCLAGAGSVGTALLKFIHGGGPAQVQEKKPLEAFQSLDCALHITTDYHSGETLEFVRSLKSDLGIIYGARILKA